MCPNPQFPADLITFTEEILNGKFHFFVLWVDIGIQKFDNHSSVKLIRDNITLSDMFQFESVSLNDTLKKIRNLNSAKNGTFKNIPTRCLKKFIFAVLF